MKSQLQEILENLGYQVREYSGRGMFGRKCLGIVTDEEPFTVGFNIGQVAGSANLEGNTAKLIAIHNPKVEQLGRSSLIIYWENLEYAE